MPKKSVREMNWAERMHYSLSSKMFHTISRFSALLSIVAIIFGFVLYTNALRNQYVSKAGSLSGDVSLMIDNDKIASYVSRAREIYNGLDEKTKSDKNSEAYKNAFQPLVDEDYETIHQTLQRLCETNQAQSLVIGTLMDDSQFLYLFEGTDGAFVHSLGSTVEVTHDKVSAFEALSTFAPVVFDRNDEGYTCTGTASIQKDGVDVASVVVNYSLNEVARLSRRFLWQYFLVLGIVTILANYLIVLRMKKTVVQPIQELNEAARSYASADRKAEESHFDKLNIKTGDEIESLSLVMADMEREMHEYIKNLTTITAEKERIGTELNIASQIQEGMLPSIFPPFPEKKGFDIYATMDPAKEVGGDFYDFFLIDENHLGVVIADVSGKGVPAALFMMASKILINNYAIIYKENPAKVLELVNQSICSNNKAEMFVTVWFGVLDIASGQLTAANAGHEYPAICKHGEEYKLYTDKHGFVIGGMEDVKYRSYDIQLQPGDQLFIYTDGVPEATNANEELFGVERMLKALNEVRDNPITEVLRHMKLRIDEFVGDAPQFDDITMLLLKYKGDNTMEEKQVEELTIEATIDNVPTVTEFVNKKLEELDCPMKAQMQIDIAIDELFSNIAQYAYNPETGPATVRVDVEENPMAVLITFIDHGKPYDPLKGEDPDVTASLDEREPGGLGVFLVKQTMDDVAYEYKNGQNILSIKKHI